jgi:hypothetical protein
LAANAAEPLAKTPSAIAEESAIKAFLFVIVISCLLPAKQVSPRLCVRQVAIVCLITSRLIKALFGGDERSGCHAVILAVAAVDGAQLRCRGDCACNLV